MAKINIKTKETYRPPTTTPEPSEPNVPAQVSTPAQIPDITSVEWTDYVLSLLTEKEKVDGYPLSAGLRRIFPKIMGKITSQNIEVLQCPNNENERRATVKCTILFTDLEQQNIIISDASDCFYGNTVKPFSHHPVATASTMAEARCLRKALRLNTLTVEESVNTNETQINSQQDELNQSIPADENQKFFIIALCNRLKIDVNKFLKTDNTELFMNGLTKSQASEYMKLLTNYNRGSENGGLAIPTEILK